MNSAGSRIRIGAHVSLITEQNRSGPGAYIRGVEFDGVTGMTGHEDRDWPALNPAFSLAERLGWDGIWFRHRAGAEFVPQGPEAGQRCRLLALGRAGILVSVPSGEAPRSAERAGDPDGWPTGGRQLVTRLLGEPARRMAPALPLTIVSAAGATAGHPPPVTARHPRPAAVRSVNRRAARRRAGLAMAAAGK